MCLTMYRNLHYHHCIVRNFQFRKFLPVYSNLKY